MFSAHRIRLTLVASLAAATLACGRDATRRAASAPRVAGVDDFGDTVRVGPPPSRIVSLNPSTTEILFALGAGRHLVGRTHWDVYPDSARAVPDLGNGIRPNVEAVLAARPELVVLYASGDNRSAATSLRAAGVRVVSLKNDRIADLARAVRLLAAAVGDSARGETIVDSVSRTLDRVRAATAGSSRPRVLWPLIAEPLYVIGGGSFLSEIVDIAGGTNVYADMSAPSPQVSREDVLRRGADVVLASSSGAARIRTDPAWRGLAAVRAGRVYATDSTLVERPSVRLGEAAVSIARFLHPELADRLGPAPAAPR